MGFFLLRPGVKNGIFGGNHWDNGFFGEGKSFVCERDNYVAAVAGSSLYKSE